MSKFELQIEEIKKHLDSGKQNWLFGAGISYNSNIPLMIPLTKRVEEMITDSGDLKNIQFYSLLKSELESRSHIEHFLSHIGDLIAIAERSKSRSANIQNVLFTVDEMKRAHRSIISFIGSTVRFGYASTPAVNVGTVDNPIVEIEHHVNFVRALFSSRSNMLSRSKLKFFTTNYDTLLEDALGLEKYIVKDGFSGGLVGFWNPQKEFKEDDKDPRTCFVYKLHGSIDWCNTSDAGLIRTRYGTRYLPNSSDIMIYPQATKYIETQKDPFSYLFSGLRNAITTKDDNILVTCGYSFGDEHINAEIEAALLSPSNKTTVLIFCLESPDMPNNVVVNPTLDRWLSNPICGQRIRVLGTKGIYHSSTIVTPPDDGIDLDWWTFSGLTNFLSS